MPKWEIIYLAEVRKLESPYRAAYPKRLKRRLESLLNIPITQETIMQRWLRLGGNKDNEDAKAEKPSFSKVE